MPRSLPKPGESHFRLRVGRGSAGLGLFAGESIPQGAFIIEYIGERITPAEADRRGGRYLIDINTKWILDGSGRENTARYINHGCDPNCEAVSSYDGRVKIYALRDIDAGEELLFDYGPEYYRDFIAPYGCQCGATVHRG